MTLGPRSRAFLLGAGAALLVAALGLAFIAYQQPELLLDWMNLRYCG